MLEVKQCRKRGKNNTFRSLIRVDSRSFAVTNLYDHNGNQTKGGCFA